MKDIRHRGAARSRPLGNPTSGLAPNLMESTKLDNAQAKEGKTSEQQRTHTREYKLEAIRLTETSDKLVEQVARELGLVDSTFYLWCKSFGEQAQQVMPRTASASGLPHICVLFFGSIQT
jgi:hypothetical protein